MDIVKLYFRIVMVVVVWLWFGQDWSISLSSHLCFFYHPHQTGISMFSTLKQILTPKYFIAGSVSWLADRELFWQDLKIPKIYYSRFRIQVFSFRIKQHSFNLSKIVHYIKGEAGSRSGSGSGLNKDKIGNTAKGKYFLLQQRERLVCRNIAINNPLEFIFVGCSPPPP